MNREQRILTVGEVTRYIRMKLEADPVLEDVWIRGEISNFTHHSSGHMYFTLKDKTSRIKCVMFASHNRRLPFMPGDGMMVLARGSVTVYERDGNYQFYVAQMQPDGIGGLYLAFEQLKAKLEAEGLFDAARKKPIPRFPKAVGVITSPTGAAVRDIITTLTRRFPAVPVLLYPVPVQGKQAAPAIAGAIRRMNELGEADVLIVGRGGGSLEELWAFNEEIVARSIAASNIPVISAVGHEIDFTIADFAADLRAATPTAAAELAVPHHLELRRQIADLRDRLLQAVYVRVRSRRERLAALAGSPVFTNPRRLVMQQMQRVDLIKEQLAYRAAARLRQAADAVARLERSLVRRDPRERVKLARQRLAESEKSIARLIRLTVRDRRQKLSAEMSRLDALSPLKVMLRGYSLVYDEGERTLIKSSAQVKPGDRLKIRLAEGRLDCRVEAAEP